METKITKKLMVLLSLVMLFTNLSAQYDTAANRKIACERVMKQTSYVFVGKYISSKAFRGADGGHYISNLIEVEEVIKGSLQKGTIEIITGATHYTEDDGTIVRVDDSPAIIFGGTSLYFCRDAEKKIGNSGEVKSNPASLNVVDAVSFSGNKVGSHPPYGMFNDFTKMSDVFDYLKNNYNIQIDKSILEKKSLKNTTQTTIKSDIEKQTPVNDIPYEQKVKNYQEHTKKRLELVKKNQRAASCAELFISEYLDGQGNNKSVEIYNPSFSTINLSGYSILIYHGSSYIPTTIALTGTISAQGTHVVSKPNASSAILAHTNQTSNNLNFNGDEIVVLNKAAIHIDKIGVIGTAIGSGGWTLTPTGSTVNTDLRRKYAIGVGDTAWSSCKSEWDVFSKDSVNNLGQHQNFCAGLPDPNLFLTFANGQTTGTGSNRHYEFDIMVSSDVPTWFDYCVMYISYGSGAFGNNIVANSNVTVTRYPNFNSATYFNPQSYLNDRSPDTLVLPFGTDVSQSSWSRTQINSLQQKMLHVSIKVQGCGNNTNIAFTDTSTSQVFSSYTANQNDDPNTAFIMYTYTYLAGALNQTLCQVKIDDFNSPMRAGIGDVLTITGSGFGNSRGSGQVKFTNADYGGVTYLQRLSANDYVSWADNQIEIRLPNFVDSLSTGRPDTVSIVGGGNFIVKNNAADSMVSANNMAGSHFSIFYNINQEWNTVVKNRVNLRKADTSGGYMFRLNPIDFPVGSNQRYVFTEAARDWRCMTGANVTIGPDTIMAAPVSDGINYVSFASISQLAVTTRRTNTCPTNIVSLKESDMQFNNTPALFAYDTVATNNIPAGQYDFYEVCSHEIGHVVGLAHNVIATDLMFWSEGTGVTAANRKRLVAGTSPDSGGVYNVTHSITSVTGCSWITMSLGQCQKPNGIEQYQNNSGFILFPNPSNGNITVQSKNELGLITIYNSIGELVYQQKTKERSTQIDLSQQASGIYLVKIQNQFIKVIKQ